MQLAAAVATQGTHRWKMGGDLCPKKKKNQLISTGNSQQLRLISYAYLYHQVHSHRYYDSPCGGTDVSHSYLPAGEDQADITCWGTVVNLHSRTYPMYVCIMIERDREGSTCNWEKGERKEELEGGGVKNRKDGCNQREGKEWGGGGGGGKSEEGKSQKGVN